MSSFPTLHTARCTLRQIVPADQRDVFKGLSDPEVVRYYGVRFDTYEAAAEQMAWYADMWENGTGIWWAICDRESGAMMGAIGINSIHPMHHKAEIGFWLMTAYQRKGIIMEVLPEAMAYAFGHLRLHRLEAFVETENSASEKVLLRLGFLHEGTQRECEWKNGRWISLGVWGLLTDEALRK